MISGDEEIPGKNEGGNVFDTLNT
ncbi:hypothetical protein R3I94_013966 [Phoxinus phoxinus]